MKLKTAARQLRRENSKNGTPSRTDAARARGYDRIMRFLDRVLKNYKPTDFRSETAKKRAQPAFTKLFSNPFAKGGKI